MLILLNVFLAGFATVSANPVVYDQRQTGKTNIRVEVKDAVIVAVGDDDVGGDYDYNYDYSDLTIKPGYPLTSTPTSYYPSAAAQNLTGSSSTIQQAPLSSLSVINSNLTQNPGGEIANNGTIFDGNKPGNKTTESNRTKPEVSHHPEQIPVVVVHDVAGYRPHKFLPVKTIDKEYVPSSRIRGKAPNGLKKLPDRVCSPGFFLDTNNMCRRRPNVRPKRS